MALMWLAYNMTSSTYDGLVDFLFCCLHAPLNFLRQLAASVRECRMTVAKSTVATSELRTGVGDEGFCLPAVMLFIAEQRWVQSPDHKPAEGTFAMGFLAMITRVSNTLSGAQLFTSLVSADLERMGFGSQSRARVYITYFKSGQTDLELHYLPLIVHMILS